MTWKNAGLCLLGIAIAATLLAPIGIYIQHFGSKISSNHELWGQMGSAMSGIYSPILALATICILALQYRVQRRQQKYIETKGVIDAAYSDAMAALQIIDTELASTDLKKAMRNLPDFAKMEPHEREKKEGFYASIMGDYLKAHDRLLPSWQRVYLNLVGLKDLPSEQVKLKFQVGTTASYHIAIALDRLHYLCMNDSGVQYLYDASLNDSKKPE
ncbi:hypothetical protein [Halopseudomonas aestusnigri]|uniref:hypothetical protein n=1 Tax=Halopseudomonas aestusnigri TaxID=857252 RepID=UPI003001608E